MTVGELIEELEDLRETLGGDTEVRVAQQPSYPLESRLDTVTGFVSRAARTRVVYLAAEASTDYAPRAAWDGGLITDEEQES